MAETRRWLRSDGSSSVSLAQDTYVCARYIRLVRFSFLILITRFAILNP
jgi:hypothetical protein